MDELTSGEQQGNINVTLDSNLVPLAELTGMEFPCPLCGTGLPILRSKRSKPYFICNLCGVQVFVRGKTGIRRLRAMAASGILVSSTGESASHAIQLYNRLGQLKLQKDDLKWRRGIFLRDENVENTILAVDAEIEKVEGELAKVARKAERETDK